MQLAEVMIGAAIEAANTLAGQRMAGLNVDTLRNLYTDHQFIHLTSSNDFAEQHRFRQGTQAAELIDYFATQFHIGGGPD